MSHPATKMKKVWLEKSCSNILSSEVKKISLLDLTGFESDPKVCQSLTSIFLASNEFRTLLTNPLLFKSILLLMLTMTTGSFQISSGLTGFHWFYLTTFWRRLSRMKADEIVLNLFNAIHSFMRIPMNQSLIFTK